MNLRWIPAGNDRVLAMALGTSIVLHGVLLAVHFKFPGALRWQASEPRMDVVLVNAKTRDRPTRADVLAQANLDRGGNVDEARQQEMLAAAREAQTRVPQQAPRSTPAEQAAPQPSGRDLADLALAAMRLQAQIDRQIEDYQKRPRKKFIGANAAEYRFAQYEEDWRAKVERWGTVNYPAEARGKVYGNLRLTVTIRPDGNVDGIELDRSSGLKILDAAAFKIVRMAGPFAAFPPAIRRDTDLLVITRTWFFGQGDKIWTE